MLCPVSAESGTVNATKKGMSYKNSGKRKKRFPWFLLIIAILVFFFVKEIYLYRTVKVESISGTVDLFRRETETEIYEGMQLNSDDEVSTNHNSMLIMLVDSDKHLVAEEDTSFTIKTTGTQNKGMVRVVLTNGGTLVKIDNKLNKNSSFEVDTPNAVMSVRGTIFTVQYDSDKQATSVEVKDGTVHVDYADGSEAIDVVAGDTICVKDDDLVDIREVYPDYNGSGYFGDYGGYLNADYDMGNAYEDTESGGDDNTPNSGDITEDVQANSGIDNVLPEGIPDVNGIVDNIVPDKPDMNSIIDRIIPKDMPDRLTNMKDRLITRLQDKILEWLIKLNNMLDF